MLFRSLDLLHAVPEGGAVCKLWRGVGRQHDLRMDNAAFPGVVVGHSRRRCRASVRPSHRRKILRGEYGYLSGRPVLCKGHAPRVIMLCRSFASCIICRTLPLVGRSNSADRLWSMIGAAMCFLLSLFFKPELFTAQL